ncbi:transposase [Candidatus Magnetomorum sp. HK-1]|nr:transposase [Candidatus Magnetomorum sp. HK-1]
MPRSRYKIYEQSSPHFLTCTIINWIPVFTRQETTQIILDSFIHLQKECSVKLFGYVILENHIHWIAQAENLPKEIHRFKSYTGKMLVRYFEKHKVTRILDQFALYKKKHKIDRKYQVWEEGSHPQLLQNKEMLIQKLEYIHLNPVKRGYVDEPKYWRYSSARNYNGDKGLIEIYKDWW